MTKEELLEHKNKQLKKELEIAKDSNLRNAYLLGAAIGFIDSVERGAYDLKDIRNAAFEMSGKILQARELDHAGARAVFQGESDAN